MAVKHAFVSAVADGGDLTQVRPSGWNADHLAHDSYIPLTLQAAWTNMPSGDTELFGNANSRVRADLTNVNQFRFHVRVGTVGAAGADLRLQYSTNEAAWNNLDGGAGPELAVDSLGTKVTPWSNLAAGAKADVWIRVMGKDGNGAADPQFFGMMLQVR